MYRSIGRVGESGLWCVYVESPEGNQRQWSGPETGEECNRLVYPRARAWQKRALPGAFGRMDPKRFGCQSPGGRAARVTLLVGGSVRRVDIASDFSRGNLIDTSPDQRLCSSSEDGST